MNINIIMAIDHELVKAGLISIIQNGILGGNVVSSEKANFINKIESNFFEIAIVEINKKNKVDFELLNSLVSHKNRTKIFVLSSQEMDIKTLKFIKYNDFELILNSDTSLLITKKIKFHIQYYRNRNSFRKRKMNKLKSLNNLLSKRELEIGTMLINGDTISSIAIKKNLATSTVSTYKRRTFEKINVSHIIDMAKIFNNFQQQLIHD